MKIVARGRGTAALCHQVKQHAAADYYAILTHLIWSY
jgi:hypothetical protein